MRQRKARVTAAKIPNQAELSLVTATSTHVVRLLLIYSGKSYDCVPSYKR